MFFDDFKENRKFVRVSREEIVQAKEIGDKDGLFRIIYKLISDDLMREDFALYTGNIELSTETENNLNDILNKLWKREVPKILLHMLLYGFCALYVTIDNGKISINVPDPVLYDIYIEYDYVDKKSKYKFFWRKEIIDSVEESRKDLKEGFKFPYGLLNDNYRIKKGVDGMPSNMSYSMYSKNLIEKRQAGFERTYKQNLGSLGIEDPNVFLFFSNLGDPNPLTGGICSEAQGAFHNFDLIKSLRELFVTKEVQKANPIIFVQPERKEEPPNKLEPVMIELQTMTDEISKEIREKIEEENKRKTEEIESKLNSTNNKIKQLNKKSHNLFTNIVNMGSHKTLVDLPVNTVPHVINNQESSQDSLVRFIESIRAEICTQFAIPVHKIMKMFNAKTNIEEITYKNTIQSRKMEICNIFTILMRYTALPLIIHDIISNNNEEFEIESFEDKIGDSVEARLENHTIEHVEDDKTLSIDKKAITEEEENKKLTLIEYDGTDMKKNPLFKMISNVMKKDKHGVNDEGVFIDSTLNINSVLGSLYDTIRTEVSYKKPKTETLETLRSLYNEGIISKTRYLEGLLDIYEGDPIIHTALFNENSNQKNHDDDNEYISQSDSDDIVLPKYTGKFNKRNKKKTIRTKRKQRDYYEKRGDDDIRDDDEDEDDDDYDYDDNIGKRKFKDLKKLKRQRNKK